MSTLALGFIEFQDAYAAAGQVEHALATLKWGADWLNAARYAPDAFVAVTWKPGEWGCFAGTSTPDRLPLHAMRQMHLQLPPSCQLGWSAGW